MPDTKLNLDPITNWLDLQEGVYLIAGPARAESEEQVMKSARALHRLPQVKVFRAGIRKPGTRPDSCKDMGVEGWHWLQRVKEETGLAIAVEVAKTSHVEEALESGVDMLWIGARTTANPYSVRELAAALSGAEIPVWVKNPLHPHLQLWIGALEQFNRAGVKRLGAIHCGFLTYKKNAYRTAPIWSIPIELKRYAPDLPFLCEPGSMAGNSELLQQVSQKALALTMNGLMVETYSEPGKAVGAATKQILPSALANLITSLDIRQIESAGLLPENELNKLRQESNAIDKEILEAMARRMAVVKKIGNYKKLHNLAILQVNQWNRVVEDRINQGEKLGLDKLFVKQFYKVLHNYAIKLQWDRW